MKKLLLTLIVTFIICASNAQSLDYGNDADTFRVCNALSGNNFLSDSSADTALDKILNVIGASKRFVLQSCGNINNAVALSYKGVRYIMYDPDFMRRISSSNDWVNMFILAHEVGHHINGHSVDVLLSDQDIAQVSLSQKRTQELEADEFAGFVLGRLGANLNDALSSVSSMSDGDDSYSTHPSRSKRQAAIRKGFNESGGKVDSSRSVEKGQTIDSKYSNSRYADVKYVFLDDYYTDATYEGYVSTRTNEPFGYGTINYKSGPVYKGEMSGGWSNGYGVLSLSDGRVWEGYFVNAVMVRGEKKSPDGTKIIGTFKDGELNGEGQYIFSWGSIEGVFNLGNPVKAIASDKDGNKREFGFLDGSGGKGYSTLTTMQGIKIKAFFENGKLKGTRRLVDFADEKTKFQILDNKTRKKLEKEGFFKNGVGFLIYYTSEIKTNYSLTDFVLEDIRLGYGVGTDDNGNVYRGYFSPVGTQMAGYGELIWNDPNNNKKSYYGMFWNNNRNGYGQLTYKDGRIEKGIFIDGELYKSEDFDLDMMQKLLKDF